MNGWWTSTKCYQKGVTTRSVRIRTCPKWPKNLSSISSKCRLFFLRNVAHAGKKSNWSLLLKFIELQNSDIALELTNTLSFWIFQIKMYLKIPSHVGRDAVRSGPLDPEDECTAIFRNVGNYFPSDTTSHTSILESSTTPLPTSQILKCCELHSVRSLWSPKSTLKCSKP